MPVPIPAVTDLTTLEEVKLFLGQSASPNDEPLLQQLISAVSLSISAGSRDEGCYLNRVLMTQTYTEIRNGNDGNRIATLEWPITSVQGISYYGTNLVQAANNGAGWLFDDRMVYVRGSSGWIGANFLPGPVTKFTTGYQNVAITYTAGYWLPGQSITLNGGTPDVPASPPAGVRALPFDIRQACTEAVAIRYRQKSRWADSGAIGLGGERITYFMGEMAPPTKAVLDRYKRIVPRVS